MSHSDPKHGSAYRPEIDGLRAFAVLPVLVYHLEIYLFGQKALPGGFLGVDVFFVISGYLITRILLASQGQKLSRYLIEFWGRRIRRIFPLVTVVVFATTIAGYFLFTPKALKEYLGSALGALFSFSNLYFYTEDSYVADSSQFKPLLHTWSLAVEEQFYLFFPVLLFFASRILKKPVVLFTVVSILSLASTIWISQIDQSFNFFSITSRAWELGAGAIIAFYPEARTRFSGQLAFIGAMLIGGSYLAVKDTYWHPSPLWTLLPVIGAVLVIRYSMQTNLVGRVLSLEVFRRIGLLSFGIYLWHWPLISIFNMYELGGPAIKAVELVAPFILATATYFLVEKPFRSKRMFSRNTFVSILSGATATVLIFLAFSSFNVGSALRLGEAKAILFESFERSDLQSKCGAKSEKELFDNGFCTIGDLTQKPSFIVFGDSHTLSLLDVFADAALKNQKAGLFAYQSGCPPILGIYPKRTLEESERCHMWNLRVKDQLSSGNFDQAVLVARWSYYSFDEGIQKISTKQGDWSQESSSVLKSALLNTFSSYSPLVDKLYFFEDVPAQNLEPSSAYRNPSDLDNLSVTFDDHQARNKKVRELMPMNSTLFDPTRFLCDSYICPIGTESKSFYFDNDHLSKFGASRLFAPIDELLDKNYN